MTDACRAPRSRARPPELVIFDHSGLTMHDSVVPGSPGARFVLVHGIGAVSRYFSRLAPLLAASGNVHTLELPGYGRTPKRQSVITVAGLATMVRAYLRSLPPLPTVLIGHSMGAQTIAEVARTAPALVAGLVLIGPVCTPGARSVTQSAVRLACDTAREPVATNAAVFWDYLAFGARRYVRTLPAMLRYRLELVLPELDAPVLVLRGQKDPISSPDWGRSLAARTGRGRFAEIPGHAHVVQHSAPQATADAINAWWQADGQQALEL